MKVTSVKIEVVEHSEQRYDTAGDWFFSGTDLLITISDTGNWIYNMAIGLHELVEALLCAHAGVSQKRVDAFDTAYEDKRKDGDNSEPGDDPKAPYHLQHGFATSVERLFVAATGQSWKKYDDTIAKL